MVVGLEYRFSNAVPITSLKEIWLNGQPVIDQEVERLKKLLMDENPLVGNSVGVTMPDVWAWRRSKIKIDE
jgi:hypothetical protein